MAEAVLQRETRAFWEQASCGTRYASAEERRQFYEEVTARRDALQPYIASFARFERARGQRLLEVGVGAGTDFSRWCQHAEFAVGVDLTDRGLAHTRERLALQGVSEERYALCRVSALELPFAAESFDIVYSFGVLHVTPDMEQAFSEVRRVLKPGGLFLGMVYNLRSWTSWLLYLYHGPLKGRLRYTPRQAVAEHLECPGTRSYTVPEVRGALERAGFRAPALSLQLSPSDTLEIGLSTAYDRPALRWAQRLYPSWLVRRSGDRFGNNIMIEARREA